MKLHEILTRQRIALGKSIDDVADESGVSKGTVSKILCGITSNPQIESLKAIAYSLGLKLDDLSDDAPSPKVSNRAMALALRFDELDEHGKQVMEAILQLEAARMADENYRAAQELIEQMRIADELASMDTEAKQA